MFKAIFLLPFVAVTAFYFGHFPALNGVIIGFGLALGNFSLSAHLASRALRSSLVGAQATVVLGFVLRLTVLGVIFYLVSRFSQVNFVVLLVSFVLVFTGLLFIEVRNLMVMQSQFAERSKAKK